MKEVKINEAQFSEDQLSIIEAALRYSLDQARDSNIRVLDWGDGANRQFSEQAYKIIGDVTIDEAQMVRETETLLDNALAQLQHIRDAS